MLFSTFINYILCHLDNYDVKITQDLYLLKEKYALISPTYLQPIILLNDEIKLLVDLAVTTKMKVHLPKHVVFDSLNNDSTQEKINIPLLVFLLSLGTDANTPSLMLGKRDGRIEQYIIQLAQQNPIEPTQELSVIFGLSCNPLTNQHIYFIQHLSKIYSNVIILLNAQSPLKNKSMYLPTDARLQMLQTMQTLYNLQNCIISRLEIDRVSPSRMISTLAVLNLLFKQHYTLALGLDELQHFTKWYQWADFASLCTLKFYPRPGYKMSREEMLSYLKPLINADINVTIVCNITSDCTRYADLGVNVIFENFYTTEDSSTNIRNHYASGSKSKPDGVLPEIHEIILNTQDLII